MKQIKGRPLLLVVFLLLAATAFAQQQDLFGLTDFPVPAWPQDGIVPASLKENYVFVDLAKNEYVVAYPENLGTDSFAKDGPGKMKINRYPLLRNVAPQISAAITPAGGSRLKYAYTVANLESAKQSIDTLLLVLSEASANDVVKPVDGWHSILQRNRKVKLRSPEWIRNGAVAVWSFSKPEMVVQPGSSKRGFDIESDLRPGFSVAFARKSESIDVRIATHGNVPKEVKLQMDEILQVEYNSRTALTLAPKFDRSADDHTIAEDFIQGIFTLSRAGTLDLNSDFVRNTLSELTAVKPGASAAGSVKFTTAPKTPAETDIATALKISLRLN